jgi:uncharacterized protein involved in exopolysaccharide biosynthesis
MSPRPADTAVPMRRVSARDFAAVLFRRKWVIVGVFAVTTTATAGIILSQPTVYESTGKILLKRGLKDNLFENGQRTLSWKEDLSSEIETATSSTVIEEAQKLFDSRRQARGKRPIEIDARGVEASVVSESNVLAISYKSRLPALCVEITDALIDAYIDYRRRAYALPYPSAFFDAEIQQARDGLLTLQDQRRDLLERSGLTDGGLTDRFHLRGLEMSAQNVTTSLRRDVTELRSRLSQMKAYLVDPTGAPDIPFAANSGTGDDVVVTDIKKQLVNAQIRYSELTSVYQADTPDLVNLRAQIADLRALLEKEVRSRIKVVEMEAQAKEAELARAQADLADARQQVTVLPPTEALLADLDRRIDALQKNYKDLMDRSEQARIQQATSPQWTVLVLSPASRAQPTNTKDYVRIALAPIFSLIVGLGLAFFLDSLDSSVKTPRDAEEAFELPVLATLTEQRKR